MEGPKKEPLFAQGAGEPRDANRAAPNFMRALRHGAEGAVAMGLGEIENGMRELRLEDPAKSVPFIQNQFRDFWLEAAQYMRAHSKPLDQNEQAVVAGYAEQVMSDLPHTKEGISAIREALGNIRRILDNAYARAR